MAELSSRVALPPPLPTVIRSHGWRGARRRLPTARQQPSIPNNLITAEHRIAIVLPPQSNILNVSRLEHIALIVPSLSRAATSTEGQSLSSKFSRMTFSATIADCSSGGKTNIFFSTVAGSGGVGFLFRGGRIALRFRGRLTLINERD